MRKIKLTQAQYDSLSPKDNNTLYYIKNAGKLYKGTNQYWKIYRPSSEIVVSLVITTAPEKKVYTAGEQLDLSGMVVTATYMDGHTADVKSQCTFIPAERSKVTLGTTLVEVHFLNRICYQPITVYANYLCFTANQASTICLTKKNTSGVIAPWTNIETSTDRTNWTPYTWDTTTYVTPIISLANAGDKVYFRGTNNTISLLAANGAGQFDITGSIAVSGSINTLLDINDNVLSLVNRNYCFYRVFAGCPITTAPELPSMTLGNNCYDSLFEGCIHLLSAPKLPATNLAISCYLCMFLNCNSLVTVPNLPATTLFENCYTGMFLSCMSLYVHDDSTTGYTQEWKIPTNNIASGNYIMTAMFNNCPGSRATLHPNFDGIQKTYYVQNLPIGD